MTSPRTTAPETDSSDIAQNFLEWTRVNSRVLTAGAVIVLVAGAAYWFYLRSVELRNVKANNALNTAQESMGSGNMPLAQSDLQQVVQRYGSTGAGVHAAVLLAQIDYDAGKYQDGISTLGKVLDNTSASMSVPEIKVLQGDGYMQLGKPADAAKAYESAADASAFPLEKSYDRGKAARAYQAAGDTAKARQIWTDLLTSDKANGLWSEARVRLGELTTTAAKK